MPPLIEQHRLCLGMLQCHDLAFSAAKRGDLKSLENVKLAARRLFLKFPAGEHMADFAATLMFRIEALELRASIANSLADSEEEED